MGEAHPGEEDPSVCPPEAGRIGGAFVSLLARLNLVICNDGGPLPPCQYERACLMTIQPEKVLEACRESLSECAPASPLEAA